MLDRTLCHLGRTAGRIETRAFICYIIVIGVIII